MNTSRCLRLFAVVVDAAAVVSLRDSCNNFLFLFIDIDIGWRCRQFVDVTEERAQETDTHSAVSHSYRTASEVSIHAVLDYVVLLYASVGYVRFRVLSR